MTESKLRNAFVATAKSYIGKKEGGVEHKFIIDTYNTIKPLPRGYKVKYTDDWCATFVSAMAVLCGITEIIPLECSCGEQIKILQAKKAWVENDAYVPTAGDIIYYDWQDSGIGDNVGWADHVGIVESVTSKKIRVIEGNRNNGVDYREIAINGKNIRGFGVPKFADVAKERTEMGTIKMKTETELAKEWAIKEGIFKGYGNGNYGWKDALTREQLAIILYRLSQKKN